MLFRLSRFAIVTALAISIGLHWGFLQSVAWVGMVVTFSQKGGIGEGLEKTFDGKHPCALCKQIAKGRQSEKKSEFSMDLKKFEFLAVQAQFVFTAPRHLWYLLPTENHFRSLRITPPTPPPRAVLL